MCSVDIAVLGQVWWNHDEPTAFPDFNTKHKCRNFEAVRQWAYEHQAPERVPEDYLQPPRSLDDVYEAVP
jgi:Mycotoxin biosynthesis protein UstYa